MTDTPVQSPAPPPTASSRAARLRRDQEASIVDAKAMRDAARKWLPLFVAADKGHAVKRIDAPWLAHYEEVIGAAEKAIDGRTVRAAEFHLATRSERQIAVELCDAIRAVRDDIATSYPGDKAIAREFAHGTQIRPQHTGATIELAGRIVQAWDSVQWRDRAVAAGVTKERRDEIETKRGELSAADMGQQATIRVNTDGTVQKDALVQAMNTMTARLRKVAAVALRNHPEAAGAFKVARPRMRRTKSASASPPAAKSRAGTKNSRRGRRMDVRKRSGALLAAPRKAAKAKPKAKRHKR